MRVMLVMAVLLLPVPAHGQSDAERMAVINGTSRSDLAAVTRRFQVIIDDLERLCPSEEGPASIPDRLVYIHQDLEEADVNETLLSRSMILHTMTASLSDFTDRQFGRCTDIWVAYSLQRQNGLSPSESMVRIHEFYGAIFRE